MMNKQITSKDYITVMADGVTVGDAPATTYRKEQIWYLRDLPNIFKDIQQIVKNKYGAAPIAMRVMSSKTHGEYANPGTPSPRHGKNIWGQVVFKNGIKTNWVFLASYHSASACAEYCAFCYGSSIQREPYFRSGVFNPVAPAIKQQLHQAEKTNIPPTNLLLHDVLGVKRAADKALQSTNLLLHNLVNMQRFTH